MKASDFKEQYAKFTTDHGITPDSLVFTGSFAQQIKDDVGWVPRKQVNLAMHPAPFWVVAEKIFNGHLKGVINEDHGSGNPEMTIGDLRMYCDQSPWIRKDTTVIGGVGYQTSTVT